VWREQGRAEEVISPIGLRSGKISATTVLELNQGGNLLSFYLLFFPSKTGAHVNFHSWQLGAGPGREREEGLLIASLDRLVSYVIKWI
jgi:hypothetical protein